MKAVILSVRPKWCELIANGQKTIDVHKTRPRKVDPPFRCYIYETRGFERVGNENFNCVICGDGRGKVIGEFVCDRIEDYSQWEGDIPSLYRHINLFACIDYHELYQYLPNDGGYGWHISDLVIYENPRALKEFYRMCDGMDDTEKCWDCENAVGEEFDCGINGKIALVHPPQSWCYVEVD